MLESRETELIKAIIDNLDDSETEYTKTPQSRNEEILVSILNETEYTKTPQSREEELLLELKEKIGGLVPPVPPVIKRVTGNPIEFTDGADAPLVKCTTAIQGNQDLHGYDKPWVGGSGKNKCSNDTTLHLNVTASTGSTGTFGTNNSYDVYYFRTSDYENIAVSCDKTKLNSETIRVCYSDTIPANGTTYLRANNLVPGNYRTVDTTYTYIIFVFYWNNISDKSLIQIENGTVCTDYEPYSNICPITAYTEGKIEVRGKNLFDKDYGTVDTNKVISATGEITNNDYFSTSDYTSIDGGNNYTIQAVSTNPYEFLISQFDSNKNFINRLIVSYTIIDGIMVGHFATDSVCAYVKVSLSKNGALDTARFDTLQIEKGSTSTAYEPYTHTTHTATFSQTIYQGNADFVGESARCDWPIKNFSGGSSENWVQNSSYPSQFAIDIQFILDLKFDPGTTRSESLVINKYECKYYSAADRPNGVASCYRGTFGTAGVGLWLAIRDDRFTSLADFKSELANNPLIFAYPINTPTTETITPTNLPIKSLFGYNHIESSTGEMEIDYITDAYQNFVDTVESALPNTTRNLLSASKGGTKAMDIFLSLENWDAKEEVKEEDGEDKKEVDEIQNGVKEEIMDDR